MMRSALLLLAFAVAAAADDVTLSGNATAVGNSSRSNSTSKSATRALDGSEGSGSEDGSASKSKSKSASVTETSSVDIDDDDLAAAGGNAKWAKDARKCRDRAAKGDKSGKCCRLFGFGCKKAPRFECPEAFEAGVFTGQEVARAKYCCREHNVCRERCDKEIVAGGNVTAALAEGCCVNNGVCLPEKVVAALEADAARDATERAAGKVKRGVAAEFAGNFGILTENPMFWVAKLRRSVLQKARGLRVAPGRFYITRIGKLLENRRVPTSAEDLQALTVTITRDMNDALVGEEAALVAEAAFDVPRGERALARLMARGVHALQVDGGDQLFMTGELLGDSAADNDAVYAELSAAAGTAEGDYGLPFTPFAAGDNSEEETSGLDGLQIALLVGAGALFAGLVVVGVMARKKSQQAQLREGAYSKEMTPSFRQPAAC